ncbi:MAG TPA: hypothetical protein VHV09_21190 [Trebonia sp.]|nr:hypothetical protein [Trebonia sp.]
MEKPTMTEKFRADQIGSLLRPEALLAARRGHDAGEGDYEPVAEGGNLVTEDEQYAKLALVADVAAAVWRAQPRE